MAIDLFKMAQDYLSDDLLGKASSFLGESKETTRSGFSAAIPTLMAGLISKGSDTSGAKDLFQMISKPELSGNLLNNLGGLFGGTADSSTTTLGGSILNMLFGDKLNGIGNTVARVAGLKSGSGSSLLKLAAPFLMSLIGKQVKSSGAGLGSFVELLMGQKDNLKKYAPAGLLESLGGSLNLGSLGITGDAARTMKATATQGRGFMRTALPFILILLAALLGFYFFRGNKGPTVADTQKETGTPTTVAIKETAQSIYNVGEDLVGRTIAGFENLGNFMRHRLSTGRELIIPEFGVESKMIGFIESKDPVTKELWFDFDRILFETGSATLKTESMGQLTNIAEIMKAFPNVHLKIGGYTDNVGDPAANLRLSQARAEAVRAMIISQGINAARLTAEGYGEQHPVASNDTEQGRAKNRRVAARVTQK